LPGDENEKEELREREREREGQYPGAVIIVQSCLLIVFSCSKQHKVGEEHRKTLLQITQCERCKESIERQLAIHVIQEGFCRSETVNNNKLVSDILMSLRQ